MNPLVKEAVKIAIGKAEVHAEGTCVPPLLDLDAVKERADKLGNASQTKTDIYGLIVEVKRLRKRQ